MITSVFVVSFKIAAPITHAILIADIDTWGYAKAVPQNERLCRWRCH